MLQWQGRHQSPDEQERRQAEIIERLRQIFPEEMEQLLGIPAFQNDVGAMLRLLQGTPAPIHATANRDYAPDIVVTTNQLRDLMQRHADLELLLWFDDDTTPFVTDNLGAMTMLHVCPPTDAWTKLAEGYDIDRGSIAMIPDGDNPRIVDKKSVRNSSELVAWNRKVFVGVPFCRRNCAVFMVQLYTNDLEDPMNHVAWRVLPVWFAACRGSGGADGKVAIGASTTKYQGGNGRPFGPSASRWQQAYSQLNQLQLCMLMERFQDAGALRAHIEERSEALLLEYTEVGGQEPNFSLEALIEVACRMLEKIFFTGLLQHTRAGIGNPQLHGAVDADETARIASDSFNLLMTSLNPAGAPPGTVVTVFPEIGMEVVAARGEPGKLPHQLHNFTIATDIKPGGRDTIRLSLRAEAMQEVMERDPFLRGISGNGNHFRRIPHLGNANINRGSMNLHARGVNPGANGIIAATRNDDLHLGDLFGLEEGASNSFLGTLKVYDGDLRRAQDPEHPLLGGQFKSCQEFNAILSSGLSKKLIQQKIEQFVEKMTSSLQGLLHRIADPSKLRFEHSRALVYATPSAGDREGSQEGEDFESRYKQLVASMVQNLSNVQLEDLLGYSETNAQICMVEGQVAFVKAVKEKMLHTVDQLGFVMPDMVSALFFGLGTLAFVVEGYQPRRPMTSLLTGPLFRDAMNSSRKQGFVVFARRHMMTLIGTRVGGVGGVGGASDAGGGGALGQVAAILQSRFITSQTALRRQIDLQKCLQRGSVPASHTTKYNRCVATEALQVVRPGLFPFLVGMHYLPCFMIQGLARCVPSFRVAMDIKGLNVFAQSSSRTVKMRYCGLQTSTAEELWFKLRVSDFNGRLNSGEAGALDGEMALMMCSENLHALYDILRSGRRVEGLRLGDKMHVAMHGNSSAPALIVCLFVCLLFVLYGPDARSLTGFLSCTGKRYNVALQRAEDDARSGKEAKAGSVRVLSFDVWDG